MTISTPAPPPVPANASTGELMSRLTDDLSTLIRDELRLAQAETAVKAKKAGLGLGLFGGAGVVALFGVAALVAAAILGLAIVVNPWLAALLVGAALLVIAGGIALLGRRDVAQAVPPMPTEAVHGIKADVDAVREGARQ